MNIEELVPLRPKTTMRIGGAARYFAEIRTREDVEEAWRFAKGKNIPLVVLGGGSNTIFADKTINALIVRITANAVEITDATVRAETGIALATLVNECANRGLDLSPLTGIPGSLGGAVFGNAGQGPQGMWIGCFIQNITAFVDGTWHTYSQEECRFRYRESAFKKMVSPIIWEITFSPPTRPSRDIQENIESLLRRRMETQPSLKTAGSCFKATREGMPVWKLIDTAGFRGFRLGGVSVSEKHANFLINEGQATFDDALAVVRAIQRKVETPLEVEMRFIGEHGEVIQ
jgi:UDP-N-acetylmuramate dehydrogenase